MLSPFYSYKFNSIHVKEIIYIGTFTYRVFPTVGEAAILLRKINLVKYIYNIPMLYDLYIYINISLNKCVNKYTKTSQASYRRTKKKRKGITRKANTHTSRSR